METNPLKFVRAPGNFQSTLVCHKMTHKGMVEYAVHLWRNGKTATETCSMWFTAEVGSSHQDTPVGCTPLTILLA